MAPLPKRIIDKSLVSNDVIIDTRVSKYARRVFGRRVPFKSGLLPRAVYGTGSSVSLGTGDSATLTSFPR